MSKTSYIQTNIPFSIDAFIYNIAQKIDHVEYQKRADNLCYLWFAKTSTRGIDVSIEENNTIEIRNTSMSNNADYTLTNIVANAICKLFEGTFYKEDEDYEYQDDEPDDEIKLTPANLPVFSDQQIESAMHDDTKTLRLMITQLQQPIAVFGPVRKTHFGTDFMKSFEDKTLAELTIIMHNYIQTVNYSLPDYSYGNVMETGDGENRKILKLLTNVEDCMIDKYDYILLDISSENLLVITNDDLNTILPLTWNRADEYTIVAPVLSDIEWQNLLNRAIPLNKINELQKLQ